MFYIKITLIYLTFYFYRYEDLTDQDKIDQDMKCDRTVCLYGYVRGAHLKRNTKVHLIGLYIHYSIFSFVMAIAINFDDFFDASDIAEIIRF